MRALAHRGPDDQGEWADGRVMLGHRRLSIIDLSAKGRQPLANETGTVQVIFNGEIYNFRELHAKLEPRHRFRSCTDTEVLVHGYEEWGIQGLLERISGMFAFAVWDAEAQTLHLARDRIGKKPLFYAMVGGSLRFASTLPALLELLPTSPVVRPEAVQDYLLHLCVPGEESIVEGVRKLLPGHRAEFRNGNLRVERYWELSFAGQESRTEEEWIERIDTEVRSAVRRRLVSDVPVGVFLSGGVDSSLVAALMSELSSGRVTTISAGFDEPGFSELEHARRVARHLGTDHHEHLVRVDAAAILPWLVYAAGEPFGDHAVLPTLYLARAAREHVTVILTGDGGDESFAGYAGPLIARAAREYRRFVPSRLRGGPVLRLLETLEQSRGRMSWAAKQLRRVAVPGRAEQGLVWEYDALGERGFRGMLDSVLSPTFTAKLRRRDPDAYWQGLFTASDGPTDADRVLFTELSSLLPDQFLVKTDVATMAYGLEARSPLLDTAVIELASRIPIRQKLAGMESKHLLKQLARRYVPREVVDRRKHGFSVPTSPWMRGALGRVAQEILLSDRATSRGLLQPQRVQKLLEDHRSGRADHGQRLWILLILELWMQMFIDRSISPSDHLELGPVAYAGA